MSNGCIAPKSPPNAGLPQATNPESNGTFLIHRPHQKLDKIDYAKNGNIARSTIPCRQWQWWQILRAAHTLHFTHISLGLSSGHLRITDEIHVHRTPPSVFSATKASGLPRMKVTSWSLRRSSGPALRFDVATTHVAQTQLWNSQSLHGTSCCFVPLVISG